MKLRVGAATDVGKARERNEDSYLTEHPLYVVADGVGGHRGGAEASSMAVEVLSNLHDSTPLSDRIREANRAVFERQAGDRSLAGMGTTVTAVETEGQNVNLAHVGDSRAYLLRDGELRQLTEDHTLVQRLVREGEISEEEAHVHPQRNIVTRAVGMEHDIEVDEDSVDVREGDRLLLCSDGLTSMMRDESVKEIMETHADPQEAAESLVDAANRAGGLDNITVVVIDFVPGDGVELLDPASEAESSGRAEVIEPVTADLSARRPGRWRRVALWIAIPVLVIVAGLVAFKIYVDRQWYVGVQNGHVTVYRGLPTQFVGYHLSSSVRETGIPATTAERLAPYRSLSSGITANSERQANSIVDQIRRDVTVYRKQHRPRTRKKHPGGTP